MLPDDIVLKNCYYWAKRLVCKGIDFDALVSVGYIVGKPLSNAKLLKDWIRFSMIKYITNEFDNLKHCSHYNISCQKTAYDESITVNVDYISLHESIRVAKLSLKEKDVISYIFFNNLSQTQTATLMGIQKQTVHVFLNRAIEKIRLQYVKDIKND